MYKLLSVILISSLLFSCAETKTLDDPNSWVRINQLGYLPQSTKVAIWQTNTEKPMVFKYFEVMDSATDKRIAKIGKVQEFGPWAAFSRVTRLDFSEVEKAGTYYIVAGNSRSPYFKIDNTVYDGTADFILSYMRQQRCGDNPLLDTVCHQHDGYIVDHPTMSGKKIDVRGGWHDAADYLQYVTTSANACFQMMFAYEQNPEAFGDNYDASGRKGANGIPDVLDEARWGLEWLVRMNPSKDLMFNQIADDRDHQIYDIPTNDTVDYGWGKGTGRPVYFVTGEIQGLRKYKNRTEGKASTAGKFASTFALGSKLFEKIDPEFANMIAAKATDAYQMGIDFPGVCQTASCVSPYFYEEDNWVDDMELAATQLARLGDKHEKGTWAMADAYAEMEEVTPWMITDTARHYQWYPFINLGHYYVAAEAQDSAMRNKHIAKLQKGLQAVYDRASQNGYMMGVPFIWCSNNLVAGLITQAKLYRDLSGDRTFEGMEASMRDWLFGCNPWGTSMIMNLPKGGDFPEDPHTAFVTKYKISVDGGLVDGPIYGSTFKKLLGLTLTREDMYAPFQSDLVVYHDDWGDYSTNEPTMDGTASLSYYLSAMQKEGMNATKKQNITQ